MTPFERKWWFVISFQCFFHSIQHLGRPYGTMFRTEQKRSNPVQLFQGNPCTYSYISGCRPLKIFHSHHSMTTSKRKKNMKMKFPMGERSYLRLTTTVAVQLRSAKTACKRQNKRLLTSSSKKGLSLLFGNFFIIIYKYPELK